MGLNDPTTIVETLREKYRSYTVIEREELRQKVERDRKQLDMIMVALDELEERYENDSCGERDNAANTD